MPRKQEGAPTNIYGTTSTVRPEPGPPPIQLDLTKARSVTRNKVISGILIAVLSLVLGLAAAWLMDYKKEEKTLPLEWSGYEPELVRLKDDRIQPAEWFPQEGVGTNGIISLIGVHIGDLFEGTAGAGFVESLEMSRASDRPSLVRSRDDVSYDLINAARKFVEMGDFSEAEGQLRRVLERNPDDFEANSLLGSVLMNQKKNEEAILLYEQLIRRDPYKEELHNNLAIAYLRQNDAERAERSFLEAIRLNGYYEDARINFGILLYHQKRYERAVEVLAPVVDRNPGLVQAGRMLGLSYLELGRPMEARLVLEELNRRLPQDAEIAFAIARCHMVEEKSENAIAWLKLVAEYAPPEDVRQELMRPIYAGLSRDLNFQRLFSRYLKPEESAPPAPRPSTEP